MTMIPPSVKKYFWDVDVKNLKIEKYKDYIIERILEFGDEKAVSWLEKTFSKKDIARVLESSKRISPLSLNYWKLILNKK